MLFPSHTDWTNTSSASTMILLALEDEIVNKNDKGFMLMMAKPSENKTQW